MSEGRLDMRLDKVELQEKPTNIISNCARIQSDVFRKYVRKQTTKAEVNHIRFTTLFTLYHSVNVIYSRYFSWKLWTELVIFQTNIYNQHSDQLLPSRSGIDLAYWSDSLAYTKYDSFFKQAARKSCSTSLFENRFKPAGWEKVRRTKNGLNMR